MLLLLVTVFIMRYFAPAVLSSVTDVEFSHCVPKANAKWAEQSDNTLQYITGEQQKSVVFIK